MTDLLTHLATAIDRARLLRSVSCLRPSCGGLLHTVNRTDPDGNVDRVEFCSTCGTPAG